MHLMHPGRMHVFFRAITAIITTTKNFVECARFAVTLCILVVLANNEMTLIVNSCVDNDDDDDRACL